MISHAPSDSWLPDDPDVHLRFTDVRDADHPVVLADYRVGCVAARNFLDDWARHHSPHLAVDIVYDGCINFNRMICEGLYRWS